MTAPSQVLKIRRPDDWHLHLRDGDMLKTVVPYTSEIYGRAIVMPNLAPPVTTVEAAVAYRQRILDAVPCLLYTSASTSTSVTLSDAQAKLMQPGSSDINLERVEALKLAIRNGELKMDTGKIADALINEAQQDLQSN